MRESLDGPDLLVWARNCRADLELRRAEIDALNVFPIADSDTGTNLLATMRAAVAAADRAVLDVRSAAVGVPERQEALGTVEGELSSLAARDEPCADDHSGGVGRPSPHLIAQALARGATVGARGNSGIILSQVLRGIAEAVVAGPLTGERLQVALRRSAVLVRTGLSAPVEGTILTVLDRAAVAAAESTDQSLVTVARSAAAGAARALSETPAQLGVLRAAGVVDAGARGLLVLLDCLVAEVCGVAPHRVRYTRGERADHGPHRHPDDQNSRAGEPAAGTAGSTADEQSRPSRGDQDRRHPDFGDDHDRRDQAADPHFEVMYVISGTDDAAAGGLRDRLAVLGDSVVVVGDGDSTWSAHVHCRDAGAAIEAGLAVGPVTAIRIESFAVTATLGGHHELRVDGLATHHTQGRDGAPDNSAPCEPHARGAGGRPVRPVERDAVPATGDGRAGPADHDARADRGVLAVAAGAAAARLFEDAGAVVLREDRQVDTSTLLRAIRAMPNREVLVLPNGALPAQELVAVGVAARDGSRDVLLLPSASMVQGLAALAVHDRGRIAVDDAFAMSEAAATTRWGALRAARVRALTMVGMCSPGDGLGLVGHDVVVIDPDVVGAGRILLDRMLGLGGELVTLLMGADAGPELAQVLADHVTAGFPGVEVVVYSGGQQADLVQIGVE
ncbi:DAK2 domain-containing protein [Nocardia sp. FBN12]|uniref:DAK2 domain-containing protein n=1 Tax=Nocardia sp. FBN12 TaxID=3419766 RepID=UPI003CFC61F8